MTKTYNLNDLVVFGTLVSGEVVLEAVSVGGNIATLGRLEVVGHTVVEGEERGRSTNFSTHVADSSHTSSRERVNTGTLVFDDSTSSTLDSQDTGDLEDNICECGE